MWGKLNLLCLCIFLVPADVFVGAKLNTRASDFTSLAFSIQGKYKYE
jgi:hypothetical protein